MNFFDSEAFKKKIGVRNVCVTATINLAHLPTTGFVLLDRLIDTLRPPARYVLKIQEMHRLDNGQLIEGKPSFYRFHRTAQVKFQIYLELDHVRGQGFLGYCNNTGEPHYFFVEPSWSAIAA